MVDSYLCQRVVNLRKELDLTQLKFAKVIQCSPSNISEIEKMIREPSKSMLINMHKVFDVNANWLLTGNGNMFNDKPDDIPDQSINLLRIQGEIFVGDPIQSFNDHDGFIPAPDEVFTSPEKYNILKINGSSMEPQIKHGDIAIIAKSNNWDQVSGKIGVIMLSGEITIKKVSNDAKFLIPINSHYDLINISEAQDLKLIGKLSWIIRKY